MFSMFNCYFRFVLNERRKKKSKILSVDNMRPPTATLFVIFLSCNSHFLVLLMLSRFFSSFLNWLLNPENERKQKKKQHHQQIWRWEKKKKKISCLLVVNSFSFALVQSTATWLLCICMQCRMALCTWSYNCQVYVKFMLCGAYSVYCYCIATICGVCDALLT